MDRNNIIPRLPHALILLSTYNGEKYLSEQIESLIAQTHSNWYLLIRDDGSTDKTNSIIKQYAETDSRIIQLQDNLGNLNVIKSFSVLMEAASKRQEHYIFFCDQDDVWLPHKIESTLNEIQRLEAINTPDTPILVHSDLTVVDSDLKTIHASYLRFERLKRNPKNPLSTLLINNYITGCTIGMNRALLKLATPVPNETRMHDWWCSLCAAACGKIGFIDQPTILYRQHGSNSIGSKGFYGRLKELSSFRKTVQYKLQNLALTFKQAKPLLDRIDKDNEHYHFISQFSDIPNKSKPNRYLSSILTEIQPANKIRGLIFFLLVGFI